MGGTVPIKEVVLKSWQEVAESSSKLVRQGFTCVLDPKEKICVCTMRGDHEMYYIYVLRAAEEQSG